MAEKTRSDKLSGWLNSYHVPREQPWRSLIRMNMYFEKNEKKKIIMLRYLDRTGFNISDLGLGCLVYGSSVQKNDDTELLPGRKCSS